MRRYVLVTTSTAVAAVALFAGPVAAQPNLPASGDDRATGHAGNVVAKDCDTLFPGSSPVPPEKITYSVDKSNTYLDITAVAPDVDVVGVIVKGGPGYNQYESANLGGLVWNDLHSPLRPSGKPAQISHWFACGGTGTTSTATTTTTTTTSSGTSTTGTTTSTTSTTSGGTTTTTTTGALGGGGESTTPTVTTTSAGVVAAGDEDDLASTGFSGGWLVALAALLLLSGGALLFVVRTRAARR
jgi:hypothetical protein